MTNFSITKTVRSKVPRIPFSDIASAILPNDYDLSLVLIGDALGKKLNKEHKGRDYPTDILSFPLSDTGGEIFINVRKAERKSNKFNHTPTKHIKYLFIHGCLHLAGYPHGSTMESLEQKYLEKFSS
jgi:probable rRNA maturation factor